MQCIQIDLSNILLVMCAPLKHRNILHLYCTISVCFQQRFFYGHSLLVLVINVVGYFGGQFGGIRNNSKKKRRRQSAHTNTRSLQSINIYWFFLSPFFFVWSSKFHRFHRALFVNRVASEKTFVEFERGVQRNQKTPFIHSDLIVFIFFFC